VEGARTRSGRALDSLPPTDSGGGRSVKKVLLLLVLVALAVLVAKKVRDA
jgi:hypothetical protein